MNHFMPLRQQPVSAGDSRHAVPTESGGASETLWARPAPVACSLQENLRIGLLSKKVARIPDLNGFFPATSKLVLFPSDPAAIDVAAGWGRKISGIRARSYAERVNKPLLLLEDGFVRSFGLGVQGARPLSIVIDDMGMYFDATAPSRLEALLQDGGWEDLQLLGRAKACIASLRRVQISKYNVGAAPSLELTASFRDPFVLVVDQTVGDASVELGLAGPHSFTAMLHAARRENPGKRVLVRTHPDVMSGHRSGYLTQLAAELDAELVSEPVNPWALVERADRVYTVTSQLGFEALMAGKSVRCFGMPFYAGWGATEDEFQCVRRTRSRSVEEIFAAAYLLYARYVDPFTGTATTLEHTIDTIARWRPLAENGPAVCLGFSGWKRGNIRRLLGHGGTPVLFRRSARQAVKAAARINGQVVVWASREPGDLAVRAAQAAVPVARMEDGFLRSVGLGAALIPALSYVLDRRGMHYDPATTSDLEALVQAGGFEPALLARARALADAIVTARVTKYNVGGAPSAIDWPRDGRLRILVPGQVEDDASVQLGGRLIQRNVELLTAVRAAHPDAFIVFKPHPDVEQGYRRGVVPKDIAARYADALASGVNAAALLPLVDEVHTITSLLGFEALLRGCRVVTYGRPFYAGWGLTEDHDLIPARTRRATLDELVAAALILYPHYLDPKTGLPCSPELVLARLADVSSWKHASAARRLRAACGRSWFVLKQSYLASMWLAESKWRDRHD
jgi:capsular polysaccharide export protein